MRSTNSTKILIQYWRFAWKYPTRVSALLIVNILAIFTFQYLPPLFTAQILQKISSDPSSLQALGQNYGPLILGYALSTIIGGILLMRLVIWLIWSLEMRVVQDIHNKVFGQLMNQSATFHANRFGGSLVSQTNKFASAYVRLQDTFVFQIIGLFFSFVFTVFILTPKAPTVVLALLIFSVTFMLVAVVVTKKVRELNAAEASAQNKQTGALADAITNVMAVKSFAHSKAEKARYKRTTDESRLATRRVMVASLQRESAFAGLTSALTIGSLVLVLYGAKLSPNNIAVIYLVVQYSGQIGHRLWEFSQNTLRNINRALGDAQEMNYILAIQSSVQDPAEPQKVAMQRGSIQFSNVSFAFPDAPDDTIFDNLNLRIKPGEKVGLIGSSGGGKTTITKLLLRFMDISSGEVKIDNQAIADVAQDDLRAQIAYVPQEPLLFHRSLSENIHYGRPEASQREVIEAAKQARAHGFIQELPEKYDTLVGERGVKLSGGQRQRVAIARAMIKNAPILVLDEATSALDSESEALIQEALWKLMEGRTAIVIAHRLSTIQKMDRIIVLEDGCIIEQGSHKELLRANGKYAQLWNRQSGGFIED